MTDTLCDDDSTESMRDFFVDINDGSLNVEEGEHENAGLSLTFDSQETMEKVFSEALAPTPPSISTRT